MCAIIPFLNNNNSNNFSTTGYLSGWPNVWLLKYPPVFIIIIIIVNNCLLILIAMLDIYPTLPFYVQPAFPLISWKLPQHTSPLNHTLSFLQSTSKPSNFIYNFFDYKIEIL